MESKTGARGLVQGKFFKSRYLECQKMPHIENKSLFCAQFAFGRKRFSFKLNVFETSTRVVKFLGVK